MTRRPKFRFGIRVVLRLTLAVALILIWRFPPRIYYAADIDVGPASQNRPAASHSSPAEDHCIRILSPTILESALNSHTEIRSWTNDDPVPWLHKKLSVVPFDDGRIRLMAVGRPGDTEQLELITKAVAEAYDRRLPEEMGGRSRDGIEYVSGWLGPFHR